MGKDYRNWPRETFEDKFAIMASMMLRALERRRDRAKHRAGVLYRPEHEGGMEGARKLEHERWLEVHQAYERAYDGVFAALDWVCSARELLRRIKDEQEGRD